MTPTPWATDAEHFRTAIQALRELTLPPEALPQDLAEALETVVKLLIRLEAGFLREDKRARRQACR